MNLIKLSTFGLAAALLAGCAIAQSSGPQTTPSTQSVTPDAPSNKDQRDSLKKQEHASKAQAKSDKAQRKALQQEEKAQKAAAKVDH